MSKYYETLKTIGSRPGTLDVEEADRERPSECFLHRHVTRAENARRQSTFMQVVRTAGLSSLNVRRTEATRKGE